MTIPAQVLGFRPVSYVNKSTGRNVVGVELCLTYELLKPKDGNGVFTNTVFVSAENYNGVPVLGDCRIDLEMRGKNLAVAGVAFMAAKG